MADIDAGTVFVIDGTVTTAFVESGSLARLLRQYDRPGPRYTSYPTAVEFNTSFDEAAYRQRLEAAAQATSDPLSLYVHLPFCEKRCSYCGCMVIITQKREVAARYLDYLERELAMIAETLGDRRRLVQHHWGGGTPTYLTPDQIARLDATVKRHFEFDPAAERAIEIDPRVTSQEQIELLRTLGFNRLSMGVQDFTPEVQEAIDRKQSEKLTRGLFEFCRATGFDSINMDLIYGLPRQTLSTFRQTLASVVAMRPNRIAVYSYAHVPWLRPNQKAIEPTELPDANLKFELFGSAVETFMAAGYEQIGMDHFALPDDELAVAARERRLHRNFMGYTTRPAPDMIGAGVSAIGDVRGAFAQNEKKLPTYYKAVDAGRFPIERGYLLSADDLLRRHVIAELMCNFHVDTAAVQQRFGVNFGAYFAPELDVLQAANGPIADGFLEVARQALTVTPRGRLFVRNIAMAFDRYLPSHAGRPVFSRTI
jgi:oxygen-independent coproporphyrinogen III oxidase